MNEAVHWQPCSLVLRALLGDILLVRIDGLVEVVLCQRSGSAPIPKDAKAARTLRLALGARAREHLLAHAGDCVEQVSEAAFVLVPLARLLLLPAGARGEVLEEVHLGQVGPPTSARCLDLYFVLVSLTAVGVAVRGV